MIELGCGTAYVSAWLARRGARPVGIDVTPEQLATARALQAEHGLDFPLIEGSAEAVPLPDDSFDLAISEYGASLWCDPEAWIPEAARLLRPGGRLWFLTNTPLVMLTMHDEDEPSGEALARPQFGMRRFQWSDGSVEFHLPHGELIALLGRCGFTVEALHELQAPEGATTRHEYVTPEWARRWPSEEIWVARLRRSGHRPSPDRCRRERRARRGARGAGSRRRRGPRPLAPGAGRQRAALLLPGPHALGRRSVVLRRHHGRPVSAPIATCARTRATRRAAPATSRRRASTTSAT